MIQPRRLPDYAGAVLSFQGGAGEVVGQDPDPAPALLGQSLGAPLAQADAVAVAPGGDGKGAALLPDGKAGAAQPQSRPQGGARHRLAADRQGVDIARRGVTRGPEPGRRVDARGRDAEGVRQRCADLLGREGDGDLVVLRGEVGAAVHRPQVGQGRAPDIFAGLGLPVGDGKVAGPRRRAVVVQHRPGHLVHQGRKAGIVGLVGGAPVAAQDRVGQAALPPGRVDGQPGGALVRAVVPAVEDVAVAGHRLCLEGLVRPADRHLGRHRADEVVPHRKGEGLAALAVLQQDLTGAAGRGRGGGGQGAGFGRRDGGNAGPARIGRSGRGGLPQQRQGEPVARQGQGAAQHQQGGGQENNGFFHAGTASFSQGFRDRIPPPPCGKGRNPPGQKPQNVNKIRTKSKYFAFEAGFGQFWLEFI